MAFVMVHGRCVSCSAIISFNPDFVPSIRVTGEREPLCRACHARWNEIHRTSKGLPSIKIDPRAYEPQPWGE